ncbi:MAG: hypothetical protein ACI959_001675 [Limisphaerales bacterium]|jgi:hypothetical protein
MAKEYQLLLTVVFIGMSIGLYALSRAYKASSTRSKYAAFPAFTSFLLLGFAGWLLGGLIPAVGNWISFLFIAVAAVGILVVLTGADNPKD